MPWKNTRIMTLERCYLSDQRQRFIEDYLLNYYSISELAERFTISRRTAHKWIN
jgi:predicted DNA-binding protein YlxM (UPF0122 family)